MSGFTAGNLPPASAVRGHIARKFMILVRLGAGTAVTFQFAVSVENPSQIIDNVQQNPQ
jgi:hypothetical protein